MKIKGVRDVKLCNEKIPSKVKPRYKNGTSDWIGRTKADPSPIIYLSGATSLDGFSETEFIQKIGAKYRCYSYAYCARTSPMYAAGQEKLLEECIAAGGRVFMDSGAHSFHKMLRGSNLAKAVSKNERMKLVEDLTQPFLEKYAEFIRYSHIKDLKYDFYVTLDAQRHCPLIYKLTKQLQSYGIHPVPVYHGDQSIDWVRKYLDEGHKLIGVGFDKKGKNSEDAIRRYYSSVFELTEKYGASCHGFAVTGDMTWEFPWYSVDSTTWLKAAAYGKILDIRPEKQRVTQIHISPKFAETIGFNLSGMDKSVRKHMRDMMEKKGFDLEEVQNNMGQRALYNAKVMVDAMYAKSRTEKWSSWTTLV